MRKCPHTDIRFCPLYHAAHEIGGYGCDDGRLAHDGCAVDRDLDYTTAIGRLRAVKPRMVAEIELAEWAEDAKHQRARNMRAACIH